jgi:hypothetical protein
MLFLSVGLWYYIITARAESPIRKAVIPMTKVRISTKDMDYIMSNERYPFIYWDSEENWKKKVDMVKTDHGFYFFEGINDWLFALLWLPNFLYLGFRVPKNLTRQHTLHKSDKEHEKVKGIYARAEEIWEKYHR